VWILESVFDVAKEDAKFTELCLISLLMAHAIRV
jgi:hypothetical protein